MAERGNREGAWAAARRLYVADPDMEVFEFEALLDNPQDPRLAPPPATKPPPARPKPPARPPAVRPPRSPARSPAPNLRAGLVVFGFLAVACYLAPLIMAIPVIIAIAIAVCVHRVAVRR